MAAILSTVKSGMTWWGDGGWGRFIATSSTDYMSSYLPEIEGVRRNVIEVGLLLLLDKLLEGTDVCVLQDLNSKYAVQAIAEHPTIELEFARYGSTCANWIVDQV